MTEKTELADAEATFQQEDSEQPIPPADIVAYNVRVRPTPFAAIP